ncbi:MAG: 4-hydroxy-tetrahydrodipicolinate reductase, partial [Flavobacteriaceae bacterium]|nr:4-hydroxy-tetrahydrodipicolinate reductase [Flavobacteriaceae bacterium]
NNNSAFLYASNFSIGVNLFFKLNEYLAKMMKNLSDYKVELEEIHHIHKLDAPSGTAITLANSIIDNSNKENWSLDNSKDKELLINVKRVGEVPGTHSISYTSKVDKIEIEHEAFSRNGFAYGAVIAAEWLIDKKGVFSMKDVLNL